MADEVIYLLKEQFQGKQAVQAGTPKMLAQLNPASTAAQTLYTVPANTSVDITMLCIANVDNQSREFTLYYSEAGGVYDNDTVLMFSVELAVGESALIDLNMKVETSGATFGIESDKANELNFTLFGTEYEID